MARRNPLRCGSFFVDAPFIYERPEIVKDLFSAINGIVVEARYSFDCDAIEYVVIADCFDPVTNPRDRKHYPIHKLYREWIGKPPEGHQQCEIHKLILGSWDQKAEERHEKVES